MPTFATGSCDDFPWWRFSGQSAITLQTVARIASGWLSMRVTLTYDETNFASGDQHAPTGERPTGTETRAARGAPSTVE